MLILLALLTFTDQPDLIFGPDFEDIEQASENFLNDPYSMQFAANGHLYVLDRISNKIHQWDEQRKYVRSFGARGQGPGEMNMPLKIEVAGDTVWVWDFSRRFSSFTTDGTFLRSFNLPGIEARKFAVLSPELFLLSYRGRPDSNQRIQIFQLMDGEGKLGEKLAEEENTSKLIPGKNPFNGTYKSYGPEGDIQKAPDGTYYFGFSQNKELVQVNNKGEILSKLSFPHKDAAPSDEEKEAFLSVSFPNRRNGGRIKLSDLPGLAYDFSHPKSYYTQFMITGDRVVFVLTPIGDMDGAGNGFNQGSYLIYPMAGGNPIARGKFNFSEDSTLLMRDGRALAIVATEEGYKINEVFFKGIPSKEN